MSGREIRQKRRRYFSPPFLFSVNKGGAPLSAEGRPVFINQKLPDRLEQRDFRENTVSLLGYTAVCAL